MQGGPWPADCGACGRPMIGGVNPAPVLATKLAELGVSLLESPQS